MRALILPSTFAHMVTPFTEEGMRADMAAMTKRAELEMEKAVLAIFTRNMEWRERASNMRRKFRKGDYVFCWRKSWSKGFILEPGEITRVTSVDYNPEYPCLQVEKMPGMWPTWIYLKATREEVRSAKKAGRILQGKAL